MALITYKKFAKAHDKREYSQFNNNMDDDDQASTLLFAVPIKRRKRFTKDEEINMWTFLLRFVFLLKLINFRCIT